MELKLHIRRMEPQDIPAAAQIEKQLFSQPWNAQAFQGSLRENTQFLTAWHGTELAGYCGMYCYPGEGEITNVAVAPMYQNPGVGRRMLEHLLEQARQSGIRRIFLEVRISNENAIRLYRKLGFGNCGIRKGLYQFPREDGMVMVWEQ